MTLHRKVCGVAGRPRRVDAAAAGSGFAAALKLLPPQRGAHGGDALGGMSASPLAAQPQVGAAPCYVDSQTRTCAHTYQASPYPEIVAFSGNDITVKIAFTKPDGPDVGALIFADSRCHL